MFLIASEINIWATSLDHHLLNQIYSSSNVTLAFKFYRLLIAMHRNRSSSFGVNIPLFFDLRCAAQQCKVRTIFTKFYQFLGIAFDTGIIGRNASAVKETFVLLESGASRSELEVSKVEIKYIVASFPDQRQLCVFFVHR